MDVTAHPIQIRYGGETKIYLPAMQAELDQQGLWDQILQRARAAKAEIRCQCRGHGEKRLSPHLISRSGRCYLGRYPNTGEEHAVDCRHYAVDSNKSGRGQYQSGVVQTRRDGGVSIRLGNGIGRREPGPVKTRPLTGVLTKPTNIQRQKKMSLLGLLHLLWERSLLNHWLPTWKPRHIDSVAYWLKKAAADIHLSRATLGDILLLGTRGGGQKAANRNSVSAARRTQSRVIVIAPLAAYSDSRAACEDRRIPIKHFTGIPSLMVDPAFWKQKLSEYRAAASAWRADPAREVVMIAQADTPLWMPAQKTLCAQVLDFALMAVAGPWIPVASPYEAALVDELVDAQRAFRKPLRYDAHADVVLANFELLDTGASSTPMEVFGPAEAAHPARKEEKTAYYNRVYGLAHWWSWDTANSPDRAQIPAFPPKGGGRT